MSKVRSLKAGYTESVTNRLFGTPKDARKTAATILVSRMEGKDSFKINGKTYRSVSRTVAGSELTQTKKK